MIKHLCWSSLWTFYIYLFSSISLSYQEILSVGNNSLSPSSSSTYHDLLETYFQEEYLSNLQDLLDNCHHHYSRTHNQLTTPPTIHINKKNCQYFEYFYYLLNEVNQQNKKQQHTISNEIYHQYQLQKIDTSHSYETIFENFILKGRLENLTIWI